MVLPTGRETSLSLPIENSLQQAPDDINDIRGSRCRLIRPSSLINAMRYLIVVRASTLLVSFLT